MGYYKWADQQLKDLMAKNPVYERSQYPGMQLALASQTFNSQMPGTQQFQQNMFSNQANTNAAIGRTATDAGQALGAYAGSQGQTSDDISNLQLQEMDWKKFGMGQLNDAYKGMFQQDQLMNEYDQQNYQNEVQLKGAQAANKLAKRKALWNTVGQVANLGVSLATGGLGGNIFGGGNSGGESNIVDQNQYGGWSPRKY